MAQEPTAIWEDMLGMEGEEFNFVSVNERARFFGMKDMTLSEEAMEALMQNIRFWVGSRMMRAMRDGRPAARVKVTIKVEVGDGLA